MKKLIMVVNNPAFFLSHRLQIAQEAQKQGYHVVIATMHGEAVKTIVDYGFEHVVVPFTRSGKNPFKEFKVFRFLYKLFKRQKPDVVHLVTIKPVLYGGLAARLAKVPAVVYAISGLGYLFTHTRRKFSLTTCVVKRLYRLSLSHKNSYVIVQNQDDRKALEAMGALNVARCVLIRGSGVDLNDFVQTPEPPKPIVATMVARLLKDKGVNEFVQAARLSKVYGRDMVWQLVGSIDPGNPTSYTQDEVNAFEPDVKVLGQRSDIATIYAQSHIAVLPSYREGLPKSLLEAAACGRAVVTTDVPGCRDAITPDVTGLLVSAGNAQSLYIAVSKLADDDDLRQKMGQAGHELAIEEFDVHRIAQKQVALYNELLGA